MLQKLIIITAFILSSCSPQIQVSEVEIERLIQKSDDYEQHKKAFVIASSELVKGERCTTTELSEQAGWMKSTLNYKFEPVYFIYCGGTNRSNRIYLNVATLKTFTD